MGDDSYCEERSSSARQPLPAGSRSPKRTVLAILGVFSVLAAGAWAFPRDGVPGEAEPAHNEFINLLFEEPAARKLGLEKIARSWQSGYAVMAVEILYFSQDPALSSILISTLEEQTGQRFGGDLQRWYEWIWSQPAQDHHRYAEFKSHLYRFIDPKFADWHYLRIF